AVKARAGSWGQQASQEQPAVLAPPGQPVCKAIRGRRARREAPAPKATKARRVIKARGAPQGPPPPQVTSRPNPPPPQPAPQTNPAQSVPCTLVNPDTGAYDCQPSTLGTG